MTKKMAAGGKASSYEDMTAGSGSGLGRLQKTSIASKTTTQKLKKGGIARMDKGGKPPTDETFDIRQKLVPDKNGNLRPVKRTKGDMLENDMRFEDDDLERAYELRDAAERNRTDAAVADFYGTVHPFGKPKDRTNRARNQGYLDKAEKDIKNALTQQEIIARTGGATRVQGMEKLMGMKDGYYKDDGTRDSRYAKGGMTKMAKGGKAEAFEGSAMDMAQDKKLAKKYGMSKKDYEKSPIDAKHDKQRSMKGLKMGGMTKMAAGGMSTAQDGMKGALRPKPTAMAMGGYAKGGKAEMHDKGCKCMACGGKVKYAKGGKVTFGSMQPLPGTKTVGPIRPTTATGASMKKDGMKGQMGAKASGAKPTNMMKPLGMTKMAKGGKVRGAGIAQRGTKFIGEV